jgi:type II secretory pathway pseudopilin PulG
MKKLKDEGFGLIESCIAMTCLGIILAYSLPLFLHAKLNNARSQIRTGAVMVSRVLFDEIRTKRLDTIPVLESSYTVPDSTNDKDAVLLSKLKAMGRNYTAKVTFCAGGCPDPESRSFVIQTIYKDNVIYQIGGTNSTY